MMPFGNSQILSSLVAQNDNLVGMNPYPVPRVRPRSLFTPIHIRALNPIRNDHY